MKSEMKQQILINRNARIKRFYQQFVAGIKTSPIVLQYNGNPRELKNT